MATAEKRKVRVGLSSLDSPMTIAQAKRYGDKNMPQDLRRAGFGTTIFVSDPEINGAVFFRVNYGK
ncbi:MAG: hypothetical protein A2286_13390 [Gammaproteobacteria bacterium RIFOXYA12_FULL_61_12]|nr:MAG: hypothetical protein A2286_13390 [Gammaproteobacteria bacterium RIFOXYA12_FULL_61_12]OGT91200.1 MAG: hypothetical protein A2514_02970 [Gammaproteobacteria bacterium RIFOXYD12_FULL_61_37]